ncbi:MAG: hypothetical protein GQ527_07150, partial [Bacteroidales bacterium]|nr:hypothetical protein [Bacteroidales bacterium]
INLFRLLPYTRLPLTAVNSVTSGPETGVYIVTLSDRFIKIGELKLTGWKRAVKKLATPDEEKLQVSKWTMGKEHKPVVVLRRNSSGAKLYLYSSSSPNPTANGSVVEAKLPENCPADLIDAICWQCASDVLLSIGKNDLAKTAQEKALQHGV